jgi:hypothetical protein
MVGVSVIVGVTVGEPGTGVAVGGDAAGSAGKAQDASRNKKMENVPIFLIHSSSTL